jgi:hypothetical protein
MPEPTEEENAADLSKLLQMLTGVTYNWIGTQIKLVQEYMEAISRAGFAVDDLNLYEAGNGWALGLSPDVIGGSAGFHFTGQIGNMVLTLSIQVREGEHQGFWKIKVTAVDRREILRDNQPAALEDSPSIGTLVEAAIHEYTNAAARSQDSRAAATALAAKTCGCCAII